MDRVCRISKVIQPTILGIAYLSFILMHYIPSLFFLADSSMTESANYLWACTLALLTMSVGGAYVNLITQFKSKYISIYYRKLVKTIPTKKDIVFVFAFGILCGLISIIYITDVSVYPLYLLLAGKVSTLTVNAMRREVQGSNMGSSFWYIYGIARVFLMPLLFTLIIALWSKFKGFCQKSFALLLLITVFIYNSWSAAKTPIAMLFLNASIAELIYLSNSKIIKFKNTIILNRKTVKILIGIALSFFVMVSYPIFIFKFKDFGADKDVLHIFYEGVLKRIMFKPAFLAYFQFEMFPDLFEFTYFSDIQKLASLFDIEYVDLSSLTAETAFDADSNAPPAAVGNFYAQAGWTMVVVGFFLIGFLLQGIQVWVIQYAPKSPITVAILAILCYGSFRLSMASFHTVFLSEAIIPSIIFIVLWKLYRRLKFT